MSDKKVKFDDSEISGLLKPIVLKQYKALEDSIRNVYRDINALELPKIDPSMVDSILGRNQPQQTSVQDEKMDSLDEGHMKKHSRASTAKNRKLANGNLLSTILKDSPMKSVLEVSQFDHSAIKRLMRDTVKVADIPRNVFHESNELFSNQISSINDEEKVALPAEIDERVPTIEKSEAQLSSTSKDGKIAKSIRKKRRKKTKKRASDEANNALPPKEQRRLPLEWFDDYAQFETKSPSDLLQGHPEGIPALSRYHNSVEKTDGSNWTWEKCHVYKYDPSKELFLIEWNYSKKQKWVRRFNILFAGEKLDDFSRRMEYASNARNEFETKLHKDEMISKEVASAGAIPYPKEFKVGILRKLGHEITQTQMPLLNELFKEINEDYIFAIKKTEFESKSSDRREIQQVTGNSEKFAMAALTKSGADKEDTSSVLFNNVAAAAQGMSDHMFNANSELQQVLYNILACLRLVLDAHDNYFDCNFTLPIEFSHFQESCNQNIKSISSILVNQWPKSISNIIETRLSDFFNFEETNMKKYSNSRCKSFLGLVRAVMEGQVHNLVVNGFIIFLELFGITVRGIEDVAESKSTNYLSYSSKFQIMKPLPSKPGKSFLKIYISLQLSDGQIFTDLKSINQVPINSKNSIVLSPPLEHVKASIISLFSMPAIVTENCIPCVEGLLLGGLKQLSSQWIKTMEYEKHIIYKEGSSIMNELLEESFPKIGTLFQKYKLFEFLVKNNAADSLQSQSPLKDFSEPVKMLNSIKQELMTVSSDYVEFGPIIVDCGLIKKICLHLANTSFKAISDLLSNRIYEKCQELLAIYQPLSVKIKMEQQIAAAWWKELNDSILNCTLQIETFNFQFEDVQKTWEVMYNYSMQVPENVNNAYWSTFKWPRQMQVDLEDAKDRLKNTGSLIAERVEFEKNMVKSSQAEIEKELEFLETLSDINQSVYAKEKISSLQELVTSTISLASSVSRQQLTMGHTDVQFEKLDETIAKYHRYEILWELVDDALSCLRAWINEWFMNLNAKLMVSKINSWNVVIKELLEAYDEDSNSRRVVMQLKEDVDDFWRNTNVITALRNPALKSTHWEQIKEIIGLSLIDFQSLHLVQMVDLDLELVQSVISDISLQADISHKLEMNLEKMKTDLSVREFQVIPVFDSPFFSITNGLEASSVLEDQLLRCESFFLQTEELESRQKIEKWVSQIHKALEMINAIMELQEFYLHMKPIMNDPKILAMFEKTAVESFTAISKIFSLLSEVFSKNRKFINLVYRNDLYDLIIGSGARMKNCVEGAKLFLSNRRKCFPRLYFASDSQLIETISSTSINQLSNSIELYFPAVLKLLETSTRTLHSITGITGHEGEAIIFLKPLDFVGDIDILLAQIESSISSSLKAFFKRAFMFLIQNNVEGIIQYMEQYPLQIALLSLRIYWTHTLKPLIAQKEKPKIKEFKNSLYQLQETFVDLCLGPISGSSRIKAESFIGLTIEFTSLIDEGFTQFSLVHYELDEEFNLTLSMSPATKLAYGFEYLGANNRNCLTPSTLYVLGRIINSITDQTGGPMLYSSSGTGKLNLLEEFSYWLGIRLFIEYCGDTVDMNRLKLLVKGHIHSACRLVLDNVHHLNEHHLLEIDQSLGQESSAVPERFNFPIIATVPSFEEWIGLPIKIRAKYRLIGLLQPDFHIALEAILSANFKNYRVLAKKLVLFKNMSRSVLAPFVILKMPLIKKAILLAMGLKKEQPSYQEHQLIALALLISVKDMVSSTDLPTLKEMISSIFHFPELSLHINSNALVNESTKKLSLVVSDYFSQKLQHFLNCIESKESILILGENFSGKSSIWKTGADIIETMIGASSNPIKIFHSFPNLMHFSASHTDKKEFLQIIEKAIEHSKEAEKALSLEKKTATHPLSWLILDGDIGLSWFEAASALLKKSFSESKKVQKSMQVIVETSNLAGAAPNVVSSFKVMYVESKNMKLEVLVSHFLLKSPSYISKHSAFIHGFFSLIVGPAVRFMQSDYWPKSFSTERIAALRIFNMFLALLEEKGTKGYEKFTTSEQVLWIFYSMLFSTIWIIGADQRVQKRVEFDSYLKSHLKENQKALEDLERLSDSSPGSFVKAAHFPSESTVFDFVVGKKLIQWISWPASGKDNPYKFPVDPLYVYATNDLIKVMYFSQLLIRLGSPLMVLGASGVGKSTSLMACLPVILESYKKFYDGDIAKLFVTSEFTSEHFQNDINRHLYKKRINARGTQDGKRKVIFIDDLDTVFGDSSGPLESIRMLCETESWYSKKGAVETINNLQITATAKSLHHRPDLDNRWARFFSTITIDDDETPKINEIMSTAIEKKLSPIFEDDVSNSLMAASLHFLQQCRSTFQPTPNTPQYVFLMKDILKWLRSILNYPLYYLGVKNLLHQWFHCAIRVFKDRLQTERILFDSLFSASMERYFKVSVEDVLQGDTSVLYAQPDFLLLENGRKAELRVKNFDLVKNSVKTKFPNFLRGEFEIDEGVVELSCFTAFIANNINSHCIFTGIDYQNRHIACQLAALMAKRLFLPYEYENDDSWPHFLYDVYSKVADNSGPQPVLIYIVANQLTSAQWFDVISIMKYGVPSRSTEKIQKLNVKRDVESIIRKRIRFCISFSESRPEENRELLLKYSSAASQCIIHEIQPLTEHAVKEIMLHSVLKIDFMNQSLPVRRMASFLHWVCLDLPQFLRNEAFYEEKWIIAPADSIKMAIQLFSEQYTEKAKYYQDIVVRCTVAIDKIEEAFSSINAIQEIFNSFMENSKKRFIETQVLLQEIERDRSTIEDLMKNLKVEKEMLSRNKEDMSYLLQFCATEMDRLSAFVLESNRKVQALGRAEIYEIKGIETPSACVQSVMEAVVHLLRFELRGTESIWDGVKRMISDKNFIQNILNAVPEAYLMTPAAVHTVDRISKSDEFNSFCPLEGITVLREWVQVMSKYHITNFSLEPKRKLASETETKISARENSIDDIQQVIASQEAVINRKRLDFGTMVKRNEDENAKMKEMETRLLVSQEIKASLVISNEKIEEKLKPIYADQQRLISNILMAVCIISFLGPCSINTRRIIIRRWTEKLPSFDLPPIASDFSLPDVLGKGKAKTFVLPLGFSPSDPVYETVLISNYHKKIPVILDPFLQTLKWFNLIDPEQKCQVANLTDKDLESQIEKLMEEDMKLIIVVPIDPAIDKIRKIVRKYVKTGTRLKLVILLATDVISKLQKADLSSILTFAKLSFCQVSAVKAIEDAVCFAHNEELRRKRSVNLNELSNAIHKREIIFSRVIEFASTLTSNDMYGGDLYRTMVDVQNQLDTISFKVRQIEKAKSSLEEECSPYLQIGKALSNLYEVVYNMQTISSNYLFKFEDFLEICQEKVSVLSMTGFPSTVKKYCEQVLKTLYLQLCPGYQSHDRTTFSFFYANAISYIPLFEKESIWKLPSSIVQFLCFGTTSIRDTHKKPLDLVLKNPCKAWLSDSRWNMIVELSKIHEFQQFATDFSKYGNRSTTPVSEASWQELFEAKDPLKADFPSSWQMQLSRPEKLMVIRAIRPDCTAHILDDYSKAVLGASLFEAGAPVDILLQRYRVSSSSKSITVFNHGLDEPSLSIKLLAQSLNMETPFLLPQMPQLIPELEKIIPQASSKGTWILVDLSKYSSETTSLILSRILDIQNTQLIVTPSFRIWFIASPKRDHLPRNHLGSTLKAFLEHRNDFRTAMNDVLKVFTTNRQNVGLEFKTMLFNVSVAIAMIKFRTNAYPFLPNCVIHMTQIEVMDILKLVTSFVEQGSNQYLELFKHSFEMILGSSINNDQDLEWFQELFNHMIAITSSNWNSLDDRTKEKFSLPLKTIFESYVTGDGVLEKTSNIGRGFDTGLKTLLQGENVYSMLESTKSKHVTKSLVKFKPELAKNPTTTIYEDILVELEDFKHKLVAVTKQSWFKGSEIRSARVPRKEKSGNKQLEILAKQNFTRYRKMASMILESVEQCIKQLICTENWLSTCDSIISDLKRQLVPRLWRNSGKCYNSSLDFKRWQLDFMSRLSFVNTWYISKYESKAGKSDGLIFFDLSKLFNPQDLVQAILLEAAVTMNEPLENLEIDTIFISERQKNPPERGCYICGLSLWGASFDGHKNILRDPRPCEVSTKFPYVWLLPKVKFGHDSKQLGMARKSACKVPIPLYIFKPFNGGVLDDEKIEGAISDSDLPLVTVLHLPAEYSQAYWATHSPFLTLE